ncbi:DMT family transporter [Anaerobacillus sp. MEB173]|uniref:DMT family transporter n=1 Tax=Anaerobacillus sp. MEB173 TaxID=3383345 RepID=UPI003F8E26FD
MRELPKLLIYGLLVTVMFIWGLNVVAIKMLVESFPPLTMTSIRVFAGSLVVVATVFLQRKFRMLTRQEWLFVSGAIVLGVIGHHFFLALGLEKTSASNAGIILGLVPLSTSIFAMIFLHDHLTKLRLIGIILGFTGVVFVVMQTNGSLGNISIGDLFVFGAMLTQALSFIFIKKATDTLDSLQVTAVMLFVGSILMFSISLFFVEPGRTTEMTTGSALLWVVFFWSAIIATGFGHMLYNAAIHRLGAGQTAIFINLSPFFALVGAYFFLGEIIVISQLLGFLLIVVGVIFGTGYIDEQIEKRNAKQNSRDEYDAMMKQVGD